MHRLFKTLFLLPWLSACVPSWAPGSGAQDWTPAAGAGRIHDFNWRLSGDRQVAPLQVFDDGRQTWLQFAPGQAMPALFVESHGIQQPAAYVRREPYAIVQGKWPSLIMRGGSLQARADYVGPASTAMAGAMPPPMAPPAHFAVAPATAPAMASSGGVPGRPFTDAAGAAARGSGAVLPAPSRGDAQRNKAGASTAARLYRVGPTDENMRRALARWAGLAGWTFQAEHWAVDVDIPLSASADFSDDFKGSVRELVAATELGDRPLQPCFYANQVLRVIPLSQACDRTAARAGASL